ncbi:MAG: GTPase Obg [Actinomycetota bacterium]
MSTISLNAVMSAFVDECQLNVRAGDGGAGCVSFRREGPVAFGGPNGGDGGRGGDVWLVADHNVASLLAFRDHPHRRAEDGINGMGKDLHGRSGNDLEVKVPEGTVIRDMYTGEILADLVAHGDRWRAVEGGRGGRGNSRFLANRRRAPKFAEQGEYGAERWLKLELKLMADVALVGFPNAGKSTFISSISAAKPKIANYPFTTLEPHLGVVRVDESTEFVVADIPGIIEGASEGRGLGHQFLRHIERARALCILIDLAPMDGMSPDEQERVLLAELGAYEPELLERPRVVVANKVDVADPTVLSIWNESHGGAQSMSSVTRQGVRAVVGRLAQLVSEARRAEPMREATVILRPEPEGTYVERVGDHEFRVHGRNAVRSVALNDITSPEALNYIDERLKKMGVGRLLARAGAQDGDVVWVGDFSFEYTVEL